MTIFDDVISYAHFFSGEKCESTWYSDHSIVNWKPNDSISERRAVQDWCGRVLDASKVNLTTSYCTDDIQNLGVPILSSVELPASRHSSTGLQITGAFYPVWPFDEYTCGSMFSYTDEVMIYSMTQSI